jgi:flagellar FliJ protein
MARFPLEPIRGVLQRRTEDAATALRRHGERKAQQEKRLEELRTFRREYLEQRSALLAQGTTASRLRDFEGFIRRLDEAIAIQETEVERARALWDGARQFWETQRQKERAVDVLAERHAEGELERESRLEQKRTDEFASRADREGRSRTKGAG